MIGRARHATIGRQVKCGPLVFRDTELWLDGGMSEMGEVECSQRWDDMEWVITIVPRGQCFTKCSQRVSIIFLPYAFKLFLQYPLQYVSQGACLQWFLQYFPLSAFTIFLHYFSFTNTFFTIIRFFFYTIFSFCFYNVSYKESSEKKRHIYIYIYI